MKHPGFFDLPDHLRRLSEAGDPLEVMSDVVYFEAFRATLDRALAYRSGGAKGGRPPYDAVAMFKALILGRRII